MEQSQLNDQWESLYLFLADTDAAGLHLYGCPDSHTHLPDNHRDIHPSVCFLLLQPTSCWVTHWPLWTPWTTGALRIAPIPHSRPFLLPSDPTFYPTFAISTTFSPPEPSHSPCRTTNAVRKCGLLFSELYTHTSMHAYTSTYTHLNASKTCSLFRSVLYVEKIVLSSQYLHQECSFLLLEIHLHAEFSSSLL